MHGILEFDAPMLSVYTTKQMLYKRINFPLLLSLFDRFDIYLIAFEFRDIF